jgi:FlaA1/EpsC-like NDP-sugar epimerase
LTSLLASLAANPEAFTETEGRRVSIEEIIEKYSADLDASTPSGKGSTANAVLLTGSTGSLGAQILASLLKDRNVKWVCALNRPSSG